MLFRSELHCVDLAGRRVDLAAVQLVHAALIFEHAGLERCLDNAVDMVAPGGVLSVVLQLPSATEPAVGNSAIASVQAQRESFHFVDCDAFRRQVEGRGFRFVRSVDRPLASGKAFWMGLFQRS